MKTTTCIFAILLAGGLSDSYAQDTWTRKADFGGGTRGYAVGFSIDGKGYISTGDNFAGHDDCWEYDPATNVWTQKANYGGGLTSSGAGFSTSNKGYLLGGGHNDFWEFDPIANTWTQKTDFPGVARVWAVGLSIGSKGYLGTGVDGGFHKDFWEYDPATNTWTQKADFGGTARSNAAGFSIGSKGYIGTGTDINGSHKDFYEYDPSTNIWTQKADFGGEARQYATGLSIDTKGYIGTGNGSGGSGSFLKDFWEYDPTTNTWTRRADFGGTGRYYATGFSIGSKGYIGTGYTSSSFVKDFWEYTPGENSSTCLSPPSRLVSWWSGDRTAQDVQGTNNGTLLNGTSFRKGMVGPAFSFDGVGDYVSIPDNDSLNPGLSDFTFEFWVNTTDTTEGFHYMLDKRSVCTFASFYAVYVQDSGGIAFELSQDSTGTNYNNLLSPVPINDGAWHHVALVRQGVTATIYTDGVANASASTAGITNISNNQPLRIGNGTCHRPFSGKVDELTYYNSALSASTVAAIYSAGSSGKCKPEIFVASIDPSYTVSGHGFRISTSVLIQDVNGVGTNGATVQLGVILPSGSALTFPLTTDATGQADVSFTVSDSGLYQFKVRKVSHPAREYNASLNIETTDTLVIP